MSINVLQDIHDAKLPPHGVFQWISPSPAVSPQCWLLERGLSAQTIRAGRCQAAQIASDIRLPGGDRMITRCHKMSQDVTRCHKMSQDLNVCSTHMFVLKVSKSSEVIGCKFE